MPSQQIDTQENFFEAEKNENSVSAEEISVNSQQEENKNYKCQREAGDYRIADGYGIGTASGNACPEAAAGIDFTEDEAFKMLLSEDEAAEGIGLTANDEIMPETSEYNEDLSENFPELPDYEEKIAHLEQKLADANDQLLRKIADFENFRKRMNQEKQKAIEFANESLLKDIIPVIDDFERAIKSAELSKEISALPEGKAMLDGIAMIEKQLTSRLETNWGLKRFDSAGQLFDHNIHEAMFMEKSPDVTEPIVQEDFIKGFMLKDRVIRAAKVKVLMPDIEGIGNGE
ncbi:MAG: nucleotide exchange factor GrpE [Treponema sp.]|nr:nucleotide exchange factor GrpE [Treponema sp.]